MNSPGPPGHQAEVEALGRGHCTGLVTLLFTDIVGSTQLKQTLGDRKAVGRIQRHHALVRELLRPFPDAQEVSTAGDSFFLVFARPSEAVRSALQLQHRLREQGEGDPQAVRDRIGIHLGEVVLEAGEGKPRDLYGLHVDTAARVMSLAQAGQILVTRSAFDSARQSLKGEEIAGLGQLSWLNHGPYLFKGLDESVEICEVREAGQAVLKPPTNSEKAQRQVRADEEPVLGWRPAVGQTVPNTKWVLEEKLGEDVCIEPDYLFPLLKCSDLANGRTHPERFVLVTQRRVGEDTTVIAKTAPRTWRYLDNTVSFSRLERVPSTAAACHSRSSASVIMPSRRGRLRCPACTEHHGSPWSAVWTKGPFCSTTRAVFSPLRTRGRHGS